MSETHLRSQHFGETAIMTPANAITVGRLLLTPYFIYLFITEGATWLTAVIGAIVAFSDGIDGVVARRQGATRSGAFLDPLIDKVVIMACFIAVASEGKLPWIPIIIIGLREIAMTIYRSVVAKDGISIQNVCQVEDLRAGLCYCLCLSATNGKSALAPSRNHLARSAPHGDDIHSVHR